MRVEQQCRVCGCTEGRACVTADGPCAWVEPGLCSACFVKTFDDYEELRRQLTPDKVGYLLSMMPRRIGALAFMTFLELRHFKPGENNDEFLLAVINWEGMRFVAVLIPKIKDHLATQVLSELGLRAANGVPHLITRSGQKHFPVDVPNLYTVENVSGHFCYRNDPTLGKTAFQFEDEAVDRVRAEFEAGRQKGRPTQAGR